MVADLLLGEIRRLSSAPPADLELTPRKAVLIGGSRNLETANVLGQIASLALYGMGLDDQSLHQQRAGDYDADAEVRARGSMRKRNIIIVGNAKAFSLNCKKKYPNVEVIPVAEWI